MTVTVTRDSDLAYKDLSSRSALVFNLDLVYPPALDLAYTTRLSLPLVWTRLTSAVADIRSRFPARHRLDRPRRRRLVTSSHGAL